MGRIIAMIPARLGSQRVPRKNLRLLAGKPMISYVIETALQSGVFDEVYVNTEADIIGKVAVEYGAKFYKRPEEFSTHTSGNDEFAYDFIKNTDGDILIQILPTSPLITVDEVKSFVEEMVKKDYDTLISVIDHKIACVYEAKPVNFKLLEPHISSQLMTPVQSYATVLMGWKYESFKRSMEKFGFAYHGSDSRIGYFPLKGLSEIDIDEEKDFQMAEVALQYKNSSKIFKTEYYGE
jgi:CMP-N-acetylneuraminic acid synthetase